MFAAQPAVSGYGPHISPSSQCLQTSASSPGLKGCRGQAQLRALPALHFLAKTSPKGFLCQMFFFFSLSASVTFFCQHGWGQWWANRCFAPALSAITLFHHKFFFGNHLDPQTRQWTVMFDCYTSRKYQRCFGTGLNALLSSQLSAQHWRRQVSDSLSACGKLGLDL